MDALKMLQGTTHSQSAGAPSSRLRLRFHLPHWESLFTHSGYYKGLINMPLRPKPGRRLGYLCGQSRGFVLLGKGTGAAGTMLYQPCIGRARMETRASREHARCACVWSPNPEELQGKRRDRPKSKQRGQIRLSGLTPDKLTNSHCWAGPGGDDCPG
ncbi:uncharacterized protein [Drosophila suzukii]|uniref:Uncharacterized protein n=1 Tax=Drosophila suzukii TaxID=28584 RepID=A0AB40AEY0_DROSZ|nr:uncharacterized protein LOC108011879 isoform X1 [Drosophila suzukii]